ncbi:MAG: 30S ribosomal protein S8 [Candidatus Pacearchaeota archaeon]
MTTRDWLASFLNDFVNCKKAGRKETVIIPVSKLVLEVLKILKDKGYVEDFKVENDKFDKIIVKIGKLNDCGAIKPRFFVQKDDFEKYVRRFLPARNIGILIVSTNKGIMTHQDAIEKGIGGALFAYCY